MGDFGRPIGHGAAGNYQPSQSLRQPKARLRGKTKRNIVIAVLLVVIGLLFWVTTSSSQSSVTFKDIGYSATDATQLSVDFQVTKNPGATAKCAIKAMDSGFAVVGWKVVQIGPNRPQGRR